MRVKKTGECKRRNQQSLDMDRGKAKEAKQMFQWKNEEMARALPLVNATASQYPLLRSTLRNRKEGTVYVETSHNPSSAAVLSRDGWLYLLGEPFSTGFATRLVEILVNKIREQGLVISWFGMTEKWKQAMHQQANHLEITDHPRIRYHFDPGEYEKERERLAAEAPRGSTVKPIGEELAKALFRKNPRQFAYWKDWQTFCTHGFGFILLRGESILGHALSASVEDGEVEVDIHTVKEYRRLGIARLLTETLIDQCLYLGLSPKWDCSASNEPSNRLAVRLGFEKVTQYDFSLVQQVAP